ncbi:MAG: 50S ribosomal protein L9 [Candidatus Taylorbacteria bacterium]|nr:50S ribosomal protein L9 [Candidatus Taylorbacteria bacterium]
MKIILLQDIPKIGKKYDIKTVSDGHALNLLIPKGLAEIATPKALLKVEKLKTEDVAHKKIQEDLLIMNLKAIEGVTLEIKEKANEKGHLFAGVHKEEIIAHMKKDKHIDLLPDFIVLDKPIKEVGDYTIEIKVKGKIAKLKLNISAI